MTLVLAAITLTVAGLMVGVELCIAVFVTPIFDRLPGDGGLAGRAESARVLGRVMPFWYAASIVLSLALAAVRLHDTGAAALVAGAALFVVAIVMSILLLVPVNNRAKDWAPGQAPANWREQLHRWDRYHYARLVVIGAAFILLAVGATTGSR